jgi:5-hydroxyisourate hydrolase
MNITTHVLDVARGRPAAKVPVTLEIAEGSGWRTLSRQETNEDGRAKDLLGGAKLEAATYRITFDTGAYFALAGVEGFYPYASIVFAVRSPAQHHHVPLLLSPFGYSTYRGS